MMLDYLGNHSSLHWTSLAAGTGKHNLSPKVAGSDGRYLVAYSTADRGAHPGKVAFGEGTRLWAERFDFSFNTFTRQAPRLLDTEQQHVGRWAVSPRAALALAR